MGKLLLENGANVGAQPVNSDQGESMLLKPAAEGYLEVIAALIDAGVDVNHTKKDRENATPLIVAVMRNQTQAVELLIETGGADVELQNVNVNGRVRLCRNPVFIAVQCGLYGPLEVLLRNHANPSTESVIMLPTPLGNTRGVARAPHTFTPLQYVLFCYSKSDAFDFAVMLLRADGESAISEASAKIWCRLNGILWHGPGSDEDTFGIWTSNTLIGDVLDLATKKDQFTEQARAAMRQWAVRVRRNPSLRADRPPELSQWGRSPSCYAPTLKTARNAVTLQVYMQPG